MPFRANFHHLSKKVTATPFSNLGIVLLKDFHCLEVWMRQIPQIV